MSGLCLSNRPHRASHRQHRLRPQFRSVADYAFTIPTLHGSPRVFEVTRNRPSTCRAPGNLFYSTRESDAPFGAASGMRKLNLAGHHHERMSMAVKDNPNDALAAYIDELTNDHCVWYVKSCRKNYRLWLCCQVLALTAGFGTSLLAALMQSSLLNGKSNVLAWTLVILPFVGSVAVTVAAQSRVFLRWKLRERGRREFESLLTGARASYAAATDAETYSTIHEQLRNRVEAIEKEQSDTYFNNAPSFTAP